MAEIDFRTALRPDGSKEPGRFFAFPLTVRGGRAREAQLASLPTPKSESHNRMVGGTAQVFSPVLVKVTISGPFWPGIPP